MKHTEKPKLSLYAMYEALCQSSGSIPSKAEFTKRYGNRIAKIKKKTSK